MCAGSAEGDDIKLMLAELSLAHRFLETANNILEHYREFCKRVSTTMCFISSGAHLLASDYFSLKPVVWAPLV